VKLISGRLSTPLQFFGTEIPSINLSTIAFGPTRREVPESITALYPVVSI